jgi:hypothetical protein
MNPWIGWALAALLFAVGWLAYGWQGALTALSATVFWLLLQFNRAVRVMKNAGQSPIGHIGSAVMLQSRLIPGLTMLQVVSMTHSLGRRVGTGDDVWAWQDPGGVEVVLSFHKGKLSHHELVRPAADDTGAAAPASGNGSTAPAP